MDNSIYLSIQAFLAERVTGSIRVARLTPLSDRWAALYSATITHGRNYRQCLHCGRGRLSGSQLNVLTSRESSIVVVVVVEPVADNMDVHPCSVNLRWHRAAHRCHQKNKYQQSWTNDRPTGRCKEAWKDYMDFHGRWEAVCLAAAAALALAAVNSSSCSSD